MAGNPLSQLAIPITPDAVGSDRIKPPHDDGRIVPVGQAVEHAGRALRSPVARVAAIDREREGSRGAQRFGGAAHEQAELPVAGVIAERDRLALLRAQAAQRADDHILRSAERVGAPAHPGVLGQAEDVAARFGAQHLRRQRQTPLRSVAFDADDTRSKRPNRGPARAGAESSGP